MKNIIIQLVTFLIFSTSTYAISLKDYTPYNYEVLFTNPECKTYEYSTPVESNGGDLLFHKPKNVYCKKSDVETSAFRHNSPEKRLIDWISDENTKEIFFSYLSFSNQRVLNALCKAISERNIKLKFVLDQGTKKAKANDLMDCLPSQKFNNPNYPEVFYRGDEGGIGYAHNKYFIINPNSSSEIKISFSSGNLSSGTVLHHENWHFITTSSQSYFAKAHFCMMNGTLNYHHSKVEYTNYIKECRSQIDVPEESDIKLFVIPGEGKEAMESIKKSLEASTHVMLAAHRFSNTDLMNALNEKLNQHDSKLDLVVDDDIYWTSRSSDFRVGANTRNEYYNVSRLRKNGLNVRYMETNHRSFLLHHNKYIIFDGSREQSVFAGAGNFTNAAFTKNFENFYHIKISEVVENFKAQYKKMFNEMATDYFNMPKVDIAP